MHAEIAILTGGNTVLNADDGVGVLISEESFTQNYQIGFADRATFSFFVDVFGRDP